MTRSLLAAVGLTVVAIALLNGCGGPSATVVRGATTGARQVGAAADVPGVDLRPVALGLGRASRHLRDAIELPSTTAVAGTPLKGTLVVTDDSPTAVDLTHGCRPSFAVVLANRLVVDKVGFASSCQDVPLMIQPGVNRFPVEVLTTYAACGSPATRPATDLPACTRGGPPALAAGTYDAVLEGSGTLGLPEPRPVTVSLSP